MEMKRDLVIWPGLLQALLNSPFFPRFGSLSIFLREAVFCRSRCFKIGKFLNVTPYTQDRFW